MIPPEILTRTPPENETGPKISLIVRNTRVPWVEREISEVRTTARRDGARLCLFMANDLGAFKSALRSPNVTQADGVILDSPEPGDVSAVFSNVHKKSQKLLTIDDPSSTSQQKNPDLASMGNDFKGAGTIAVHALVSAAISRGWDFRSSGLLVFREKNPSTSNQATDQEIKGLLKAGVPKKNLYTIRLDRIDLNSARIAGAAPLRTLASTIGTWFIVGSNDLAVVGGLRAAEEVNMGSKRIIGVGIGGDGALYDLQRPRKSTLLGSVLLPADVIGEKSEHEMFDWIVNKIRPTNYAPLKGIYLNRRNVRELKTRNHMVE